MAWELREEVIYFNLQVLYVVRQTPVCHYTSSLTTGTLHLVAYWYTCMQMKSCQCMWKHSAEMLHFNNYLAFSCFTSANICSVIKESENDFDEVLRTQPDKRLWGADNFQNVSTIDSTFWRKSKTKLNVRLKYAVWSNCNFYLMWTTPKSLWFTMNGRFHYP